MKKLFTILLMSIGLASTAQAVDDPHAGHGMSHTATQRATGTGVIKAINTKTGQITLAHDPIPALKWPAMIMPFKLAKPELAKGLAVGQKVSFEIEATGMDGVILSIKPR